MSNYPSSVYVDVSTCLAHQIPLLVLGRGAGRVQVGALPEGTRCHRSHGRDVLPGTQHGRRGSAVAVLETRTDLSASAVWL